MPLTDHMNNIRVIALASHTYTKLLPATIIGVEGSQQNIDQPIGLIIVIILSQAAKAAGSSSIPYPKLTSYKTSGHVFTIPSTQDH